MDGCQVFFSLFELMNNLNLIALMYVENIWPEGGGAPKKSPNQAKCLPAPNIRTKNTVHL